MSRSDYAHWNEEADWMWWQEESRHQPDDEREAAYDPNDWLADDDLNDYDGECHCTCDYGTTVDECVCDCVECS